MASLRSPAEQVAIPVIDIDSKEIIFEILNSRIRELVIDRCVKKGGRHEGAGDFTCP